MNLAAIVDGHPQDHPAVIGGGRTLTFGALRDELAALRGGLVGLGVEPGDRVAVVCANNPNFVLAVLATVGVGAVAVPLNPRSPGPELQRELAVVTPRVVVVGPAGRAAVGAVDRAAVPGLETVVACGVDLADAVALDDLLESDPVPVVERSEDDPAVYLFTSGTAGAPKAAVLTHGNLDVNQRQTMQSGERTLASDDVGLAVIPLFHSFGLNSVLGLHLRVGATLVLVDRFDPVAVLEAVSTHGVTSLAGPPVMWWTLASLPDVSPAAMASVRLPVSGAARLSRFTIDLVQERLGLELVQGYGLTEASPAVTVTAPDSPPESIGRLLPGLEARLVDESGTDVLVGDHGELWVRGPNVFAGYVDEPEATAAALDADGWLHTGDIAMVDDAGNLFIVDRAKDLIIVSGFNVYPAEVERVLLRHPAVRDCAVTGVAHPHTGETVRAFVVAEPGQAIDAAEIEDFCAQQLARYKCPTGVTLVDAVPRNEAGKILRGQLPT